MSFKLTYKTHMICFIMQILISIFLYNLIKSICFNLINQDFIIFPTNILIINIDIFVISLLYINSIIHELIHGLAYKIFGGKIKFGFKLMYAYTSEISGLQIDILKFIIILLSPLFLISLISLLLPLWLGGTLFIINLLGSTGDLYMSLYLLKYDRNAKIIDRPYGFDVLV